jgi:hypothetical protein
LIRDIILLIYSANSKSSARNLVRKYKDEVLKEFNYQYPFNLCISLILEERYSAPSCACGKECSHDGRNWKKTCGDKKCLSNLKRDITIQNSDKIKTTNKERYGSESYFSSSDFKNKTSSTIEKKYGTTSYVTSSDFKEKRSKTSLERYGVPHPMKSKEIRKKSRDTLKKKFELLYPEVSETNLKEVCNRETTISEVCKIIYSVTSVDPSLYNKVAGIVRRLDLPYLVDDQVSSGEKEVLAFIESFYDGEIVTNNRSILPSGKELDIYLPDLNLAIEYNGEFWHSEEIHKSKHNMLDKTLECESLDIHLLHIYDSEWKDDLKKQIWMSMITHKMGKSSNRIYARKCSISETFDSKFFDENHIQGDTRGSILTLSLVYDNDIVAQISISKSRYNKKHDYEILRFAVKRNTHVVGGFAKLFKVSKKILNSNSFITYANRRWSQGNVYVASSEFALIGSSKPNYMYHKNGKTLSRLNAQKHKLSKLLERFDPEKSETENMKDSGYVIVYDCGNLSFSSV